MINGKTVDEVGSITKIRFKQIQLIAKIKIKYLKMMYINYNN